MSIEVKIQHFNASDFNELAKSTENPSDAEFIAGLTGWEVNRVRAFFEALFMFCKFPSTFFTMLRNQEQGLVSGGALMPDFREARIVLTDQDQQDRLERMLNKKSLTPILTGFQDDALGKKLTSAEAEITKHQTQSWNEVAPARSSS